MLQFSEHKHRLWRRHYKETISELLAMCAVAEGTKVYLLWNSPEQSVEQTDMFRVIWDIMTPVGSYCNALKDKNMND